MGVRGDRSDWEQGVGNGPGLGGGSFRRADMSN